MNILEPDGLANVEKPGADDLELVGLEFPMELETNILGFGGLEMASEPVQDQLKFDDLEMVIDLETAASKTEDVDQRYYDPEAVERSHDWGRDILGQSTEVEQRSIAEAIPAILTFLGLNVAAQRPHLV